MKTIRFTEESGGREAWLNFRLGKVTGTMLKDIVSARGAEKIGKYRLVAESIIGSAILADDSETPMDRGTRLQKDAIERFRKESRKQVDDSLICWISDDDERIAISPDGVVVKPRMKVVREAVEAKCLSAARHVEALVTKQVPKDYILQSRQYFIVNGHLETLFFIFYDPRFPKPLDFFYLEIKRADIKEEIDTLLATERETLSWVRRVVNDLTMYTPEEVMTRELLKDIEIEEAQSEHQEALLKIRKPVRVLAKR